LPASCGCPPPKPQEEVEPVVGRAVNDVEGWHGRETAPDGVESGFARVTLQPTARPDGVRFVLVLEPVGAQLPPRPEPDPPPPRERRGAKPPAKKASS